MKIPSNMMITIIVTTALVTFVAITDSVFAALLLLLILSLPVLYLVYVYYLGTAMALRGDIRGAIRHYSRVLKMPVPMNRGVVYARRAALRNAVGDIDGAIHDYSEAITHVNNEPTLYAIRSALYLGKRDFEKALEDSDRLIQLSPQAEIGYANRAAARMYLGDVEGAIRDCNTGLEQDNTPSGAALLYNNRGTARRMMNDFYEAMADYNLAMGMGLSAREKRMVHPSILSNQGILYYLQDEYETARSYFQKAQGVAPEFLKALAGLAVSRFKMDQVSEAQKIWMDLIKQEPRYRDQRYLQVELNWPMEMMGDAADLIESMTA